MNREQRRHKIVAYGNAYDLLVEALGRFPKEMWHFRSADDPWSIHDILVHIADSEAHSYIRCRRCIAEPGQSVMAYDESRWTATLNYRDQDIDDARELFKWLRLRTHKLIQTVPESVWSHTMEHPENGTMTLDDWLDTYERHIPEHIQQMQRIYEAWQQQEAA